MKDSSADSRRARVPFSWLRPIVVIYVVAALLVVLLLSLTLAGAFPARQSISSGVFFRPINFVFINRSNSETNYSTGALHPTQQNPAATSGSLLPVVNSRRGRSKWKWPPVIVSDLKLAVCLISKSAWTAGRRFLLRVSGLPGWRGPMWPPTANNTLLTVDALTPAEEQEALSSPLWTRIVVFRDPVSRFASAYLDKCSKLARADGSWPDMRSCPVRKGSGAGGSLREVLDVVEREIQFSTGTAVVDSHFRPSTSLCQLSDPAVRSKYTVVPFETLEDSWIQALEVAPGIPKSRLPEVVIAAREIFGKRTDEIRAKADSHATNSSSLVAAWMAAAGDPSHPDREVVARIRRIYRSDYDAFAPAL